MKACILATFCASTFAGESIWGQDCNPSKDIENSGCGPYTGDYTPCCMYATKGRFCKDELCKELEPESMVAPNAAFCEPREDTIMQDQSVIKTQKLADGSEVWVYYQKENFTCNANALVASCVALLAMAANL